MDKRQWTTALLISLGISALWLSFSLWYQKHYPPIISTVDTTPASTTQQSPATSPATAPATSEPSTNPASSPATNPTTNPTTTPAAVSTMSATTHVLATTQPAESATLGSATEHDATYAMQVKLQANGAAISDVTLNQFNAPKLNPKDPATPYHFENQFPDQIPDHDATAALATRTIVIDDKPVDLMSVPWTKVSSDTTSAIYRVTILDRNGAPLAEVTKRYAVQPRSAADGSGGFELAVEQTVKNLRADRPIRVRSTLNGPTPPPSEQEPPADHMVITGYRQSPTSITQQAWRDGDFSAETPKRDLSVDGKSPLVWAAQANAYFAAILLPGATPGDSGLTLNAESLDPTAKYDRKVKLTFDSSEAIIAAGGASTLPMTLYLGPLSRDVLKTPYYRAYPRTYNAIVGARYGSQTSFWLFAFFGGLCNSCQWPWLINSLVAVLWFFHLILRDWGLAIIALVLCVRTCLHPITKRAQVQMMRMSKMAPEVEKLKKKYADDPDQLNKEMMKLYQGQIGAVLGCLPMFLQTPIWISLWSALQGTFELRQAPFLHFFGHDLTWIHDLSRPDSLYHFNTPLPIFFFLIFSINLLPLLMAVVTYINQRYFVPTPIAATPEQEQQQKMQRWMTLIFPLMFYTLPSGLNLYYLTSTSLGILESKIIRDHIKEQEELAKETGPELVPTKASRSKRGQKPEPEKPAEPGFLSKLLAPLIEAFQKAQEQAEQIRKEQNKGGNNRGGGKKK